MTAHIYALPAAVVVAVLAAAAVVAAYFKATYNFCVV
jgi:hypothetical protein